jgi:pimeloyl-ACP methyl ester carboxylesterase
MPFVERIASNVHQVLFNTSGHMPHIEEHEKTISIIRDFLDAA